MSSTVAPLGTAGRSRSLQTGEPSTHRRVRQMPPAAAVVPTSSTCQPVAQPAQPIVPSTARQPASCRPVRNVSVPRCWNMPTTRRSKLPGFGVAEVASFLPVLLTGLLPGMATKSQRTARTSIRRQLAAGRDPQHRAGAPVIAGDARCCSAALTASAGIGGCIRPYAKTCQTYPEVMVSVPPGSLGPSSYFGSRIAMPIRQTRRCRACAAGREAVSPRAEQLTGWHDPPQCGRVHRWRTGLPVVHRRQGYWRGRRRR